MSWRDVPALFREAAKRWDEDNVSRLAAALSLYMLLSIAPLVILLVAVVGLVYGEDAARGQVTLKLQSLVGHEAARSIETIIRNAHSPGTGIISTLVGIVIVLVGASGVFVELQSALNQIWRVPPIQSNGISSFLKRRFASFMMVLAVAVLLLASLVLSAGLALIGRFFEGLLPGGETTWQLVTTLVALALSTVLFAAVFRVVPDADIEWRVVWPGAFVTAVLFGLGRTILALYLGKSSITSSFGAAGSLVALVIWVYYSSQIVFFGAELTHVYAVRRLGELRHEHEETSRFRDAAEEN